MDPSIDALRASDGSGNAQTATVQNTRLPGATTIVVDTVTGINDTFLASMGTPHTFTDPITSEEITVISEETCVDFYGHVDGSNLEIDEIAPGYTDLGSEVDDIIVIRPTTQYADNLADILDVSLNDDGTLKVADGGSIEDGNGNEQIKFSQTSSAVNEVTVKNAATGNPPEIQATGDDTNIDLKLVPKGTGEVTKNGNPIDWWEELGRTTLGSAGDTITVSSLPARKYLKVLIDLRDTGGTISAKITFNSDTGSNYAQRGLDNATETTFTSQTGITISPAAAANPIKALIDIENISSVAKLSNTISVARGTSGAGNLPTNRTVYAKWENTSAQISSITVINAGTGDYNTGSEVVVLGHD